MIALQPPTYFPPLAYTALLAQVDHFILADTFRFRRKTFQNRSKLRNAQGQHWITIPLFGKPEGAPIHQVEIETGGRWREKHWRSFLYDYRSTMYFEFYEDTFRPFFETEWDALADCTCASVRLQAELFGLETSLTRATAMPGRPATVEEICAAAGARRLLTPSPASMSPGSGVEVLPFEYRHPTYRQNFEGFEAGMTALDLLFNYGREAPRRLVGGVQAPADSGTDS